MKNNQIVTDTSISNRRSCAMVSLRPPDSWRLDRRRFYRQIIIMIIKKCDNTGVRKASVHFFYRVSVKSGSKIILLAAIFSIIMLIFFMTLVEPIHHFRQT